MWAVYGAVDHAEACKTVRPLPLKAVKNREPVHLEAVVRSEGASP